MKYENGQSLIELIIAIGIFVIVVFNLVYFILDSYISGRLANEITKAIFLAEEGIEATISIRDNLWDDLISGDHGLAISPEGHWVFEGSYDTTDKFTRVITIEDIGHDRKKVTSRVTWQFTPARPQEIRLVTYLTNWSKMAPIRAMMVYAKGSDPTPKFRQWDGINWGAEQSATAVSGTIQYMVLKFARTRNEAILGTLDSTGDIRVQIWNGSSWSTTTLLANVGTTNDAYRGFDIEYETSGDRAVVVYNNANAANPAYRIWDGTSWSAPTSITVPTTGAPFWIELAPNPLETSSEIAMILLDANADVYGMVWTGNAWSNMGVTTVWDETASIATKKAIDVAYEQRSGRAMFIWGDSVPTWQFYRIWDGSTLTSNRLLRIPGQGGRAEWVRLVPDLSSNRLMYGAQDAGADLNTRLWSGSEWDTATQHPEHDSSVEDISDRNFDIVFETHAANLGKAWLIWGDGETVSRKQWSGTAWGKTTTVGDDTALVQLMAHPGSGAVFALIYEDSSSATDDIWEMHLTDGGTTWSDKFLVWDGPTVANPVMERIFIAAERFVP